jgi:class 3 adenylate cyclase/predicted TIM-barrel fold metal-dependent hydrolase
MAVPEGLSMCCPRCQHENREGARFCEACGGPLTQTCPACGHHPRPGAAFCDHCGTPLAGTIAAAVSPPLVPRPRTPQAYTPAYLAEKIITSKTAMEGERKQVTVLFADLKGSMELLADRDPEEACQLLDPVLTLMMDAVHRYEGTVNQVMGEGVMALFGAPIVHEDHAARACYAALAMQAAMHAYTDDVRRTRGLELRMRVGLNSGEVVVRAIGNDLHMDYSAVGETTYLAARMEQLATPGSVLLTAATLRLVEGLVQVHPLGPVPVEGVDELVEVFELVGASAIRRRLQAAVARGLSPFVGRQTELAALHQALERAGAGHGQVVALLGEAGVGKSRLVYELVHSHHTRDWRVLESASLSYGKATPYFPVLDLLKRYAQVEDRDDTRTIRARVTRQVLTLDAYLEEACFPAYKDWIGEYCSVAPDRLFGVACISTYDIDHGVAELQRSKKAGLPGAMVWQAPPPELSFASDHYERQWPTDQDLEVPIGMHILTGQPFPWPRPVNRGGRRQAFQTMRSAVNSKLLYASNAMSDLILTGVLERYPRLKFVLVENEVSWIPFYLRQYDKYWGRGNLDSPLTMLPSEYFFRQFYATFFNDPPARWIFDHWANNNLMWSNDYPHPNSTWPKSHEVIASDLGHVSTETRARLLRENVRELYQLPALTPVAVLCPGAGAREHQGGYAENFHQPQLERRLRHRGA